MTFLALNGMPIEVLTDTGRRTPRRKGRRSTSAGGRPMDGRRGLRRQWSVDVKFDTFENIFGIQNLAEGRAHVARFESGTQCATGLSPSAGGGGFTLDVAAGEITIDPSASTFLTYPANLGSDWSIIWSEDGVVRARRSDGAGFVSGAQDNTAGASGQPVEVSVASGSATFEMNSGTDVTIQWLAILPWLAPQTVIANAFASKPSDMPVLSMTGDIIQEDSIDVVCSVGESNYKSLTLKNDGPQANAKTLKLVIDEWDNQYSVISQA